MAKQQGTAAKTEKRRRHPMAVLCNLIGMLILLGVIVLMLPLTVPRLMGYEIFHVVSGSMEPEIPVGSIVYVQPAEPSEVERGEIIAFQNGNSVVTHRVVANYAVEGEFETKGDANEEEDIQAVPYSNLIGRVVRHYPVLGALLSILTTMVGKIYLLFVITIGLMFNMLAGHLRNR